MTCLFFGRIPLLEWREEDEEEVESLRPNERGDRPHNAKDPSDISGKLDTVADDEVDGLERLGSHMVSERDCKSGARTLNKQPSPASSAL
jgi:hypothetical protein